VNAETVLFGGEKCLHLVRQGQVGPVAAPHLQAAALTQRARHDVHGRHIAAVAVEQHQRVYARARHRFPELAPEREQGLGREAEGAGEGQVLGREADVLRRQQQQRQLVGQQRQRRVDHALQQPRVHAQRQMRAMLLHRRHRQDGEGACGQAARARGIEVAGAQFLPVA